MRMAELHEMYMGRFIMPGRMQNAREGKLELRRKQHLISMLMDTEAVEEWYKVNPLLVQQQYELVRQLQLCIGGHVWEDEQVDFVRQQRDKDGTPVMMIGRSSHGGELDEIVTGSIQDRVSEKGHTVVCVIVNEDGEMAVGEGERMALPSGQVVEIAG